MNQVSKTTVLLPQISKIFKQELVTFKTEEYNDHCIISRKGADPENFLKTIGCSEEPLSPNSFQPSWFSFV